MQPCQPNIKLNFPRNNIVINLKQVMWSCQVIDHILKRVPWHTFLSCFNLSYNISFLLFSSYTNTSVDKIRAFSDTKKRFIFYSVLLRSCRLASLVVSALDSHHCGPGSIPGVSTWVGNVVARSDRWVSSGFFNFLPTINPLIHLYLSQREP